MEWGEHVFAEGECREHMDGPLTVLEAVTTEHPNHLVETHSDARGYERWFAWQLAAYPLVVD